MTEKEGGKPTWSARAPARASVMRARLCASPRHSFGFGRVGSVVGNWNCWTLLSIATHRGSDHRLIPPAQTLISSVPARIGSLFFNIAARASCQSLLRRLTRAPTMATSTTMSEPTTRTQTPNPVSRRSTPPPPPPPAAAVPTDFRSSLSAWWNNSSYKEARYAEERLLRRMSMYEPPARPQEKGWFSWGGSSDQQVSSAPSTEIHDSSAVEAASHRVGEGVSAPVEIGTSGLIATLRNVFVPTPNPDEAPFHPADPLEASSSTAPPGKRHSLFSGKSSGNPSPASASSSTTTLGSSGAEPQKKGKTGKLVDYINTLEISSPENASSKEAVVMLHGYAAALG